jgi:hydrogenase expression/formation protein HypE
VSADDVLPTGKLPPALLRELLAKSAPLPPEVRLGPRVGEDACAIDVSGGALVVATDPITLTGSGVGAHAVVVNANDVAVMGVRPRWFLASVLFPRGTRAADVRACFDEMQAALRAADVALVGGHTEVTAAVTQTVVVGQMLGLAADGRFVRTGGARPGDAVVQLGPAPVEGAAVLAAECAARLGGLGETLRRAAARAAVDPGISVVAPALRAAALGATALHDPTEGGLACGLHELADASEVCIRLDEAAVLWFAPGVAVCEALGADPWGTLASGALLATFAGDAAEAACCALSEQTPTRVIGRVQAGHGVLRADGSALPRFDRDEVARVLGAN